MVKAGLQEVDTCVSRRQNTVAQFIATNPIMYLCRAEERGPGTRLSKLGWEQDGFGVKGMRTAYQEAEWKGVGGGYG